MQVGFSYLKALLFKKPEDNLENFYINRFGRKLYSMFFEYYTENLWGRHPSEIDASWGAQRVKGMSIIAIIKDIFGKIWNDPTPKDGSELADADTLKDAGAVDIMEGMAGAGDIGAAGDRESSETTGIIRVTEIMDATASADTAEDTAAFRTDEVDPDREIRRHLKNGDVEQVIRLLTDNGRKTAARNSTLLTFYDKNGRLVKPDASVQQRTLYGDKNTQKL